MLCTCSFAVVGLVVASAVDGDSVAATGAVLWIALPKVLAPLHTSAVEVGLGDSHDPLHL